jgi:hypothetical protein
MPACFFRASLKKLLAQAESRPDSGYIKSRVDYYNKLTVDGAIAPNAISLTEFFSNRPKYKSVYFFDTYEFIRYFRKNLRFNFLFGDITEIPEVPSLLKSRPIQGDNENSVLLNMDKVRHFIFLNDKLPFEQKMNRVIFRGAVKGKPRRQQFMQMYFGHPMCDLGVVYEADDGPPEWKAKKISLYDHLNYKFIMALEGNDVASNLKWVMSSNSIAVMPKPVYETWFMEGTLIPNHHYIEIKSDYSDLEERLNYYIDNPAEALKIIANAHAYVDQFKDKEREKLISLLVLQKYFTRTGQSL